MEIVYKIGLNATNTVMESTSNDTEFELVGLPVGVYLFTVLAFNILGDGKEEVAQGLNFPLILLVLWSGVLYMLECKIDYDCGCYMGVFAF